MNEDYSDFLPFGEIDFRRLALAINAFAAETGWSLDQIGRYCNVSKMTVSRAARGHKVCAETLLKLCIVLDLNPFELLVKPSNVSRGHTTVTKPDEVRADG